jgi:uncharacterized protein (TIGR04255 family)
MNKLNPIIEVSCTFKYPSILRIDSDLAEFQEMNRKEYPYYENNIEANLELGKIIDQILSSLQETEHVFKSEDGQWLITLTKNCISLKTFNYESYIDFEDKFKRVINHFQEIYRPSFYSDIGLRCISLIRRSSLNLENTEWDELINTNIASELANSEIKGLVLNTSKRLELKNEHGFTSFKHGFVEVENIETGYLLDMTFVNQQKRDVNAESTWEALSYFSKSAKSLFQWSITEKLCKMIEN